MYRACLFGAQISDISNQEKKALCKMSIPFYYYRSSKCLGRAVSGAEKDLNLALIGYCGYFHLSLW